MNKFLIQLIFLISISFTQIFAQKILIAKGSTWKYLDDGSNQETEWRQPGFDDSAWREGNAQFGYGDGDENTVVSFGPDTSKPYATTYFRKEFEVSAEDLNNRINIDLLYDDGAVVYINGIEVRRSNLSISHIVHYGTLARDARDGDIENVYETSGHSTSNLIVGKNVIAVEIHQSRNEATIPDLSFDLEMSIAKDLEFPLRGAFYYPWYPQTWTVQGQHVFYDVQLGYYDSSDPEVIAQHVDDMEYANIDVGIISWWGIDRQKEKTRVPMLLDQPLKSGTNLKWAMYYESEGFGNPTVAELKADLNYLKQNYTGHETYAYVNGKPVIFVYNADDGDCEVAKRWAEATNGEWYVSLKVFGGFRDCANQPDSWHQYGPDVPFNRFPGHSAGIAPGFWRADHDEPLLERDPDRWKKNVQDMVNTKEPWQLIVTFNEWGEGTAIERCNNWLSNSDYGLYLDALHDIPTSIEENKYENIIPQNLKLEQNYPNPFNPTTVINYGIPKSGYVNLTIFDILGRKVVTLEDGYKPAGNYSLDVNASAWPSGTYFYSLSSGNNITVKKMILIR